ncbi:MAG: hypothetical protein KC586_14855 [Myxococcales bacterium]|nr:hypothetical protein [Myxococcales bacterium]
MSSLFLGCGGDPVVQACRDVVDALADKAEACGGDREAYEAAFEQSLRDTYGVGCDGVDAVRDLDGLYGLCFPRLEGQSCGDFVAGDYPLACREQLLFDP